MNGVEENIGGNKKQIRLAIIGIVAFLLLILGATFAFFLIDTDNSTSKLNIKGDISKAGLATLVPGTSNLHINLSVSDMALANQGREYYGDELESNPYVLSEEEGTHTISQVQITDGEETTKYSCTAKVVVTMEIAEDNNMGSVLQPGDLILQFKGNLIKERLDLSEIKKSGTKEYNLNFILTGNATENIDAYIKLINRNANQNYLASKILKVDIKTSELSCNVLEENKITTYLRETSNGKLTVNLVNDLYRYQGNSSVTDGTGHGRVDTVNNNYICLGSNCSEISDDMYRIIGINEKGEIKVIKNISIDASQWWTDSETDIKWPQSLTFQYLNNTFYNSLSPELQKKIIETEWKYTDIDEWSDNQNVFTEEEIIEVDNSINQIYDETNVLSDDEKRDLIKEVSEIETKGQIRAESNATENINANIGLMTITDYCDSFESNKDVNCNYSSYVDSLENPLNTDFAYSWLFRSLSDLYNPYDEMTMSRFGFSDGNYKLWELIISIYGSYNYPRNLDDMCYIRPVFFLTSDIEISGEGTIESPFRVAGIE